MATWEEVKEMFRGIPSYNFTFDTADIANVVVPTEKGRDQRVYICNEGDSISITSAICKLDAVDLNKLFAEPKMRDVLFGLGVMTNHLAIKHTQLLENLDIPEVTKPIIRIAFLADALEEKITGDDQY